MKTAPLTKLVFASGFALAIALASATVGAQTKAGFNLVKEVMTKKGGINWKPAPASAIPSDVCSALQVCTGTTKLIAMKSTEGGAVIGRGLFWTQDQKKSDALVLEHQTASEVYFFLVNGDGNLAKADYRQVSSNAWLVMGNSLAQPVFEADKAAWQKELSKIGTSPAANAAAAAGDKKSDAAPQ